MPPAARLTDLHKCPMETPGTPPVPHVGGPITGRCEPTVLIESLAAARFGDTLTCVGSTPDVIFECSDTVIIGGMPAARKGDATVHGGEIEIGALTVIIGG